MTERPLMRSRTDDLEKMFHSSSGDPAALRELENELQSREVPRAIALRAKVRLALGDAAIHLPPRQEPLIDPPVSESTPQAPDELVEEDQTSGAPLKTASAVASESPSIPVEDAYKILCVPPGSSWEVIEQSRRVAVQRAHPDKVIGLNERKRSALQAEAKRANAAYQVILRSRQYSI